jgi:hypothetical protein
MFLLSCTTTDTRLENNRGRAVETAKFSHAVDPDPQNFDAVEGTSGIAGESMINNYNDSFKKQKREEIVNIIKFR